MNDHGTPHSPTVFPMPNRCALCQLGPGAPLRTTRDADSLRPAPDVPLLLVLGDRPGAHEARTRTAYTGPSGELLRGRTPNSMFTIHHLRDRASIFLTNAVRCHTPASTVPASAYNTCADTHLLADLGILRSVPAAHRVLLVTGAAPLRTVLRLCDLPARTMSEAKHDQIRPLPAPFDGYRMIVTYNPAALLRTPALIPEAHDHFHLLVRALRDPSPIPELEPDIHPVQCRKEPTCQQP